MGPISPILKKILSCHGVLSADRGVSWLKRFNLMDVFPEILELLRGLASRGSILELVLKG